MKHKLKPMKNFPGIYELLVSHDNGLHWESPKRGAKFAACKYVKYPTRRRIKKHFYTFKEAKAFKNQDTVESAPTGFQNAEHTASNRMKLCELFDYYQKMQLIHRSINTRDKYPSYAKYYATLWLLPVLDITPGKIDEWLAWLKSPQQQEQYTSRRCNFKHEFIFLRTLLNYFRETFDNEYRLPFLKRHRENLKIKEVKLVKKDLSHEQTRAFFAELRKDPDEIFYYIAAFQYLTFSRIQGVVALHFEDVDVEAKKISMNKKVVYRRGKGLRPELHQGSKSGQGKQLNLSSELERLFREWILKSGIRQGPLFQINGEWPTYRSIQYAYDKAFKKAGINFSATHILRHASLSEAQEAGKDLKVTQALAGHKNTVTTERYAKARDHRLSEVQAQVGQLVLPETVRNGSQFNSLKGGI